jgi:hypothetical protein
MTTLHPLLAVYALLKGMADNGTDADKEAFEHIKSTMKSTLLDHVKEGLCKELLSLYDVATDKDAFVAHAMTTFEVKGMTITTKEEFGTMLKYALGAINNPDEYERKEKKIHEFFTS